MSEKKSIYKLARENAGLSRTQALDGTPLGEYMSVDMLEKIENGKTRAKPEDIMAMQKTYGTFELCNEYCRNECAIGQSTIRKVTMKEDISSTVLSMITTLSKLEKQKVRLAEIMEDEQIDPEEMPDFAEIMTMLEKAAMISNTMNLWVQKQIASGKLDEKMLEAFKSKK